MESTPFQTFCGGISSGPVDRFSKVPKSFRTRKATAKSSALQLQSCFIHIFLLWREEEVPGVYTAPFLDTDELKMALPAWKVSKAFKKQALGV